MTQQVQHHEDRTVMVHGPMASDTSLALHFRRLVFVGSDGRVLGAPSRLPEANDSRSFGSLRCETESRESTAEALRHHRLGQNGSSRLVACFSHADMRFAWLFAVAWSLCGADACVQREFGGSLALEHFFSCFGLMGSDRV